MKERIIKEIKITIEGNEDPTIIPNDENASDLIALLRDYVYKNKSITCEEIETKRRVEDNGK